MKRAYKPMLARLAPMPFSNKDWIYEIKWDGFRAIAYVNKELSLRSRNRKELKSNFPEIEELKQLSQNVVLDGEIVIVKEGKPDFQALLERGKASSLIDVDVQSRRSPAVYIVFDILEKDGKSLVSLPLTERKAILKQSVKEGQHVLLSDFVEEEGEAYYTAALEKGLEGIMAKKKGSIYEQGIRSGNWLKIKKLQTCDCVILGYTLGTGVRRETFGALLLGLYDKESKPVYMGKVGTGFSHDSLVALFKTFQTLKTPEAPFKVDVPAKITWLKPELVCEVSYQVVTKDGRLRMSRFRGLRADKSPSECTVEQIFQDKLGEYVSKRNFKITTEPIGSEKKGTEKIFVVQEHYDIRLETEGVLKSWAVPKGIPLTPNEKRLAVETENHPLEYANFEGTIPRGQYGAGIVKIWDKGSYTVKVWEENKIEFILRGQKLKGRYVLVRLKKGGDKNWLLLRGRE
jgi:DNA ligase D-like protein (predicted ligase)/DNA ligase D-like protein (predicted 3'-phosphoesterase)